MATRFLTPKPVFDKFAPQEEALRSDLETVRHDLKTLDDLVRSIVEDHSHLAWLIVSAWLEKHDKLLVPASFWEIPEQALATR